MTHSSLSLPPEPPQCDAAFERMPRLVNGSLSTLEARELDAHAAHCDLCRQRLDVERELSARIRQPRDNVQRAPLAAWARFEAALLAPEPTGAPVTAAPSASSPPAPQPERPTLPVARHPQHPLRLALTLQAAAIALLSVALVWVLSARTPLGPAATYHTVSTSDPTLGRGDATWRIEFDAAMTPVEVEARLAAQGLRVLAGPSDQGIYTIGPRAGVAPRIDALRADPRVRLLEYLGPAAAVVAPQTRDP